MRCFGVGMCSSYTIGGSNAQREDTVLVGLLLRWRWMDSCCWLIALLVESFLIRGVYSHVLSVVALCASCRESDWTAVVITSSTH